MKYVIVENESGTMNEFDEFTDVMNFVEKWHGESEMSDELKWQVFVERHQCFIV
jgi:hypothetical protein